MNLRRIRTVALIFAFAVNSASANELSPLCDSVGKSNDEGCWLALERLAACHLWVDELRPSETIEFEGTSDCTNGKLNGTGDSTWNYLDEEGSWQQQTGTGSYKDGRFQGDWIRREFYLDGSLKSEEHESFANGFRHGRARVKNFDQNGNWSYEAHGSFVDGQLQGRLVKKRPNGSKPYFDYEEGLIVEGKEHGKWVYKDFDEDGTLYTDWHGSYVEGKMKGEWVVLIYLTDSRWVTRGLYENAAISYKGGSPLVNIVDGEYTAIIYDDVGIERSQFNESWVDGKLHGDYLHRIRGGREYLAEWAWKETRGVYVEGEKHGAWVTRFVNDDGALLGEERVTYINGVEQ